jgi:hypothetical protein
MRAVTTPASHATKAPSHREESLVHPLEHPVCLFLTDGTIFNSLLDGLLHSIGPGIIHGLLHGVNVDALVFSDIGQVLASMQLGEELLGAQPESVGSRIEHRPPITTHAEETAATKTPSAKTATAEGETERMIGFLSWGRVLGEHGGCSYHTCEEQGCDHHAGDQQDSLLIHVFTSFLL